MDGVFSQSMAKMDGEVGYRLNIQKDVEISTTLKNDGFRQLG